VLVSTLCSQIRSYVLHILGLWIILEWNQNAWIQSLAQLFSNFVDLDELYNLTKHIKNLEQSVARCSPQCKCCNNGGWLNSSMLEPLESLLVILVHDPGVTRKLCLWLLTV
jgi:hypothetical protein